MSLTAPLPWRSQQLVQTAWDMACETLRWPTFAELDRRLDSRYDTQAVDVLREIGPGFLYGVGPNTPVFPTDSQEVGLTVAGIAACQNTSEILAVFVEFIQLATRTEKGWQPPPDKPDAQPSLTDTDFASRSRTLPATGQDRILQLLFLIIKTEKMGWAGNSADPSGHWTVTFNREIRAFRNVTDISDYWSRRFKPWETRRPVPAPTVVVNTVPGAATRAELLTTHPALLADVLLQLIYDDVQPHCQPGLSPHLTGIVPCPQVDPAVDPGIIMTGLLVLESQGHIHIVRPDPTDGQSAVVHGPSAWKVLPDVMQTGQGAAHVLQARAVMMNPVRRSQAVRDALLAWLYGHRTHLQGAIHVDKFLSDPHSAYAGQFFSLHDIDDAASYLRDKELIKGTGIEQRRGPVIAAITASGIDCIEQGGSVADYIRPPARAAVNYSFNAPISGPNIAIGDNATQYYANYGLNAGEICELMQTIVEALPGLSLELSQQDAAEAITSQVIIETKTDTPDTTKITQALKKLRGVLATSVKSALSTALTALIDSALTKAGIPPSTGA